MTIDISAVTGSFIPTEVISPLLGIVANLFFAYGVFLLINFVLSLIRGDTDTADLYGFQTLQKYGQRLQVHKIKLGYEKRYQREKRNSDYGKWKKLRGD